MKIVIFLIKQKVKFPNKFFYVCILIKIVEFAKRTYIPNTEMNVTKLKTVYDIVLEAYYN